MIRIMGDTHGDQSRFLYNTEEKTWTEDDIIIVTGDFGFIFWNDYSEQCFLEDLQARPFHMDKQLDSRFTVLYKKTLPLR